MVITLMGETGTGEAPDFHSLMDWATTHGVKYPVVADPDYEKSVQFCGTLCDLTKMHWIGVGGVVVERNASYPSSKSKRC